MKVFAPILFSWLLLSFTSSKVDKPHYFQAWSFILYFLMTIIAVFFLSSLKFWANVQFSTLFLSILPSEAMLGCTQEEIGRAGWCAVCINSWYLPAFVFLYAPPCHCQIAAIFKRFISQISLVDDEGYVDSFVNMHDFFFMWRVSHSPQCSATLLLKRLPH